jgi:autoinducer 2-degrading protein
MLTVLVRIAVRTEREGEFLSLALRYAHRSRQEVGCLRFEVLREVGETGVYLLHQLFADEAALDAHRRTPHHAVWSCQSGGMERRPVRHEQYRPAAQ